jgi:hypothetical protein
MFNLKYNIVEKDKHEQEIDIIVSKKMLEQSGAAVYLHEFPGKSHSFPDCYADYCSIALQVILKGR